MRVAGTKTEAAERKVYPKIFPWPEVWRFPGIRGGSG
jgi:hypothetical protein